MVTTLSFFKFGGVGDLFVRVDGVMSGPFADPVKLVAFGNDGNDSIVVVPRGMNIATEFFGGPGDDMLFGAAGENKLDGGSGDNVISGILASTADSNAAFVASQPIVANGLPSVASPNSQSLLSESPSGGDTLAQASQIQNASQIGSTATTGEPLLQPVLTDCSG